MDTATLSLKFHVDTGQFMEMSGQWLMEISGNSCALQGKIGNYNWEVTLPM